jgi:hypothetical protein
MFLQNQNKQKTKTLDLGIIGVCFSQTGEHPEGQI